MSTTTIKGMQRFALTLVLAATFAGCTSVKSTYFHRDEEDTRWKKNHIKGIPITLEVPTHARFNIFETTYMTTRAPGADVVAAAGAKADAAAKDATAKDATAKASAADAKTKSDTADADAKKAADAKTKSDKAAAAAAAAPSDTALAKAAKDAADAAKTAADAADKADAAAKTAADKAAVDDVVSKTAAAASAQAAADFAAIKAAPKRIQLVMLEESRPLKTYNVTYDFITEKKIFGVDFKRPAAGPYSLTANLKNQYFTDVDHRLTDQTIEKTGTAINQLIAQLVPAGGVVRGRAKSALVTVDPGVASAPIPIDSLKCSQVFKLDAPDFEAQVAAFLGEHCCSTTDEKLAALPAAPAGPPSTSSPFAPVGDPGEVAAPIPQPVETGVPVDTAPAVDALLPSDAPAATPPAPPDPGTLPMNAPETGGGIPAAPRQSSLPPPRVYVR